MIIEQEVTNPCPPGRDSLLIIYQVENFSDSCKVYFLWFTSIFCGSKYTGKGKF